MSTVGVSHHLSQITMDYLGDDSSTGEDLEERFKKYLAISNFFVKFIPNTNSYLRYSTHLDPSDFNNSDLTRFLTDFQRKKINDKKISCEKVNEFISQLLSKGGIAKLTTDSIDCQYYPIYALLGHKKTGLITKDQVTSICILWQAVDQFIHDREICNYTRLSDRIACKISKYFPTEEEDIPKLYTYSIFTAESVWIKKFFKLEPQGFKELQNQLLKVPDSEKYFHVIPLPLSEIYTYSPVYYKLLRVASAYFFQPVHEGDFNYIPIQSIVIPSISMIRCYLKIFYRIHAMQFIPVLGPCSDKTVYEHKLKNKRILPIGMPQAKNNKYIGRDYGGRLGQLFYYVYILIRESMIKRGHRNAINQIVHRIMGDHKTDEALAIKRALLRGELYLDDENFGHLFTSAPVPWTDRYIALILWDMAKLPRFWEEEFGITLESLSPKHREVYNELVTEVTFQRKLQAEAELFRYYKKNAADEDIYAQQRLGCFYFLGLGTPISYENAAVHFKKAFTPISLYNLSLCYLELDQLSKAFKYCYISAQSNCIPAKAKLGEYFLEGIGVKKNVEQAQFYLIMAANEGNTDAAYLLGILYWDGKEVKKNPALSNKYLVQAARKEDPRAQFALGLIKYSSGKYGEALRCFSAGARNGHFESRYHLALMYHDGKGTVRNIKQAVNICPEAFEGGEMRQAKQTLRTLHAALKT